MRRRAKRSKRFAWRSKRPTNQTAKRNGRDRRTRRFVRVDQRNRRRRRIKSRQLRRRQRLGKRMARLVEQLRFLPGKKRDQTAQSIIDGFGIGEMFLHIGASAIILVSGEFMATEAKQGIENTAQNEAQKANGQNGNQSVNANGRSNLGTGKGQGDERDRRTKNEFDIGFVERGGQHSQGRRKICAIRKRKTASGK
ncbi:hypothetical protein Bpfe_031334 [Biomphalaria pfeifferi]|uniref:Uncharacterized protein n=1 Tax=Biomphalaria pfeifferi TaxID=112525 RepID=A0AAD8ETD8_BIOPF|nr:hypothetical protein Bpfe_031334 [Biomphalaria pfeifferi]